MSRQINRQWNYDDFVRLLSLNNYTLIRQSKHMIFSNGKNTIAIPKVKPNQMVIRRLIKENNLAIK
jgi:hypothetical protein